MLNMRQKQALTATIIKRYKRVSKKEKSKILDEFVKATSYNRSYARRLLGQKRKLKFGSRKQKKVVRKNKYSSEVIKSLTKVWSAMDNICGKRLRPFIPEVVRIMERDKQLEISDQVRRKLFQISPATIDRVLQPARRRYHLKGRSGTKPGSLLKSQIMIRTFADWDDVRPGFFEMDTVALCGSSLKGHHVWGLNFTDITTGWVGLDAVMGKGQYGIHEATKDFQDRLVFPILGLDSDNGSEFINNIMRRFCETHRITFTRIRPGRKNDNCYVEQKNYTTLRRFLGYSRYDTPEELVLVRKILKAVELYVNFFQPSQKLTQKKRVGAKVSRKHSIAKTPYQRLLASGILKPPQKQQLHKIYETLNPMTLLKKIRRLQTKLTKLNRYKLDEATNR